MLKRMLGSMFFLFSITLLGWLLYDPTNVQTALRLEGILSEAVVVIVGLITVAALFVASIFCYRLGRRTVAI